MSLQNKYKKFYQNIKLTRECDEYKEAREKDRLITPKVEKAFRDEGYEVEPNFMVGSFSTHTATRSPNGGDHDIDRALVITKSSAPDNPVDVKKIIKKVLSEHGFKEPSIKKPCVTADYKSKPIHIDYTVYRKGFFESHELAVGKEHSDEDNRYWDDSDPKELIKWINDNENHQGFSELTDEERAQFRRLVCFMKRWRDNTYNNETDRNHVYSIGLTIMLRKQFSPSIDDDTGAENDHEALKNTLEKVLDSDDYFIPEGDDTYDLEVELPVSPYRDVFTNHGKSVGTKLRKKLKKLINKLEQVDNESSFKKKCEILNKEFGDDFPVPESDSDEDSKSTASAPGIVGVSNGA